MIVIRIITMASHITMGSYINSEGEKLEVMKP